MSIASVLAQALTLHQGHIDKPKTATAESQEELMELIKKARKLASRQ